MCLGLSGCHAVKKANSEGNRQDSIAGIFAREIIEEHTFLFKVDRITIKNYNFLNINSATNFILIDSEKGIVQVSPGNYGGPNGVGGFTVDGKVSKYEIKTTKKGETHVTFHLSAAIGSCDVNIMIYKDSAKGIARVSSTFRNGKAILYGEVTPIDNSIFQGRYPF